VWSKNSVRAAMRMYVARDAGAIAAKPPIKMSRHVHDDEHVVGVGRR